MITPEEKKQVLIDFNDTACPFPENETIPGLFAAVVSAHPGQTAVIFKKQRLTYRELDEKVTSLARLLRQKGTGPGQIVGIMVERSFEMAIGLLAIIKAGGAYLPISPDSPVKRIVHILADSQTKILLTQRKFIHKAGKDKPGTLPHIIDLEDEENYNQSPAHLPLINRPSDPAYVIYTSGSTGRPKGVMIEHRSVVNRLNWMQRKYPIDAQDTILQKTPFVFDVSVWELFWWSIVGGKVCFLLPGFEKFPQAIVETVETDSISVMHFVPSMLSVFLAYIENSGDVERLAALRYVFASGEVLKPSHVKLFNQTLHKHNSTRLINLYGPTEATVDVTYFNCPSGGDIEKIPIGKPIDNTQMYVLASDLQLKTLEEPGELHIGGVGLARGYLNRPELTAEKFISISYRTYRTNRTYKSQKIYKTGDLVQWLPDGNIMFLGRMDNQVKIRGLRIELGEIEAVLSDHPAIRDCVVTVKETSDTIITLAAYVVTITKDRESPEELKEYMKSYLPDYMIPAEFMFLDALPLTPNGKVDRKVLLESENKR